jgi:hypothetical protein
MTLTPARVAEVSIGIAGVGVDPGIRTPLRPGRNPTSGAVLYVAGPLHMPADSMAYCLRVASTPLSAVRVIASSYAPARSGGSA